MRITVFQKMVFFALAFCGLFLAMTTEAHGASSNCVCIADVYSKQYQHFSEHLWGFKRHYSCEYSCSTPQGEVLITGTHTEWSLGKDNGREGLCDGVPVRSIYGLYTNDFVWMPQDAVYFDPIHSSSKNLKAWAKETCR